MGDPNTFNALCYKIKNDSHWQLDSTLQAADGAAAWFSG